MFSLSSCRARCLDRVPGASILQSPTSEQCESLASVGAESDGSADI